MDKQIGIIADDLTGANDSGVQLAEKGIRTSVLFDVPDSIEKLDSGIVFDTNSRALSKQKAIEKTKEAAEFLKKTGYRYIYKKMDSTLRGHVAAELQVLQETFQPDFIIVAPAFPALGRTTKEGIHFVNGTEIIKTEMANDPKHPVTVSSIPTLIEEEINQPVGLLKRTDFAEPQFREKMQELIAGEVRYIVCDAETEADLKTAAEKLAAFSENIIWSGSAGLAEILPDVLGISGTNKEKAAAPLSNQVMTVSGSLSRTSNEQVQYTLNQPGVDSVEMNTLLMFEEGWGRAAENYGNECLKKLEEGNDLVLYVPSDGQIREQVKRLGEERQLSGAEIGEQISRSIGQVVKYIADRSNLTGLVMTGGDTAKDTAKQLGAIGFRLIRQIEAGIPLGTLIGTEREFTVVTKAGAFGKENSLYHAMRILKGDHLHG